LLENTGDGIFPSDLQRASSSVKIGIFRITQNPPPAMACRFDSGYRHQKGCAKKMHTQKTQEIPGFFGTQGAKKVQGFSVDAKPPFSRSRGSRTHTEPLFSGK
jgi:hypothetical protein